MSVNDDLQAFLEKRDAERISARLGIRFRQIPREEADRILLTGDFADVFATGKLQEGGATQAPEEDLKSAFTENISISGLRLVGDLRLVGGKSLAPGEYLLVEIVVPDAPIPVRTLANVIWSEPDKADPTLFHAGLFFVGIHRQDVTKVAKFLVLQRRAKHA